MFRLSERAESSHRLIDKTRQQQPARNVCEGVQTRTDEIHSAHAGGCDDVAVTASPGYQWSLRFMWKFPSRCD